MILLAILTHIRLLDKLPVIPQRDDLFNPHDDVFSIHVSREDPGVRTEGAYSQGLRERLEQALRQEGIAYAALSARIQVFSVPPSDPEVKRWYADLAPFLTYRYMRVEIALERPDGTWIYAIHRVDIMPQNRLWVVLSSIALEFFLVIGGVVLALQWLLRPLRELVAATERFAKDKDVEPLRVDVGPVEVREAAAAFNRLFRNIRQAFVERERFLTSFSHDLRTPLTRLRLRLEQVEQDELREKLCADVDDLKNTLNETITFLRSTRSKDEVRHAVPVMPLLRALVEDRQGIGQPVTLAGDTDAVLMSWPDRLRSCFENVVDNALRYAGRADIRVSLERGQNRTWLHIDFTDDGPGIPEDKLELVLEPYVRLETSRNPGTGSACPSSGILCGKAAGMWFWPTAPRAGCWSGCCFPSDRRVEHRNRTRWPYAELELFFAPVHRLRGRQGFRNRRVRRAVGQGAGACCYRTVSVALGHGRTRAPFAARGGAARADLFGH